MAPPLKPSTASLLVGIALLGTVGAALATVSLGDNVGTTEDDMRAALTAQGYTVLEFELEDGDPEGKCPWMAVRWKSGSMRPRAWFCKWTSKPKMTIDISPACPGRTADGSGLDPTGRGPFCSPQFVPAGALGY